MKLKGILVLLIGGIVLLGCGTTHRRMETIQATHPQWDQSTVEKLADWRIEPGMTREMICAALGKPDTVFPEGGEEVWGYAYWVVTIWYHYQRLGYLVYFQGDKVVRTRGNVNSIRTFN